MTKAVDFIFDFASPNAYLVHKALPAFVARTGANIRYIPCLLGGIFKAASNKAPMVQFADVPAKIAYEMLEMRRFIAAHGITKFQMNPHFPVNTLLIMRAAIVAEADDVLDRLIDAVLTELGLSPAGVHKLKTTLVAWPTLSCAPRCERNQSRFPVSEQRKRQISEGFRLFVHRFVGGLVHTCGSPDHGSRSLLAFRSLRHAFNITQAERSWGGGDARYGDPHRHDRPPPKCLFLTLLA